MSDRTCAIVDCAGRPIGRGYCNMHYKRLRRNGDPLVARRIRGIGRDELGRKLCRDCQEWLDPSAFTTNKHNGDGLLHRCRPCAQSWQREWRFGLSGSDYNALLAAQGNACAICSSPDPGPRGWHVDHDHGCCTSPRRKSYRTCGRCVRGLLCHHCNLALGGFRDDPVALRAAADYLDRSSDRAL